MCLVRNRIAFFAAIAGLSVTFAASFGDDSTGNSPSSRRSIPQGSEGSATGTSAVEAPRLVTLRLLQLHLNTLRHGAAETVRYTLYHTRDGGKSWEAHDTAFTGPSPLRMNVPADGLWGFTVTSRDAVGLEEPGPEPGTLPDVEVVVDTTPPRIDVQRPYSSSVPVTTSMDIWWDVTDDHLEEFPVDVSYSMDNGPWTPIWEAAAPSGRQKWLVPFKQGELQLRFRARDRAGNMSEVVTETSFVLSPGEFESPSFLIVPPHAKRLALPIYYRLQSEAGELLTPDRLQRVVVWYRQAGESWSAGDDDPDRSSPIVFHAPGDGLYDVLLFALAGSGEIVPGGVFNDSKTPPPPEAVSHATVLVDTLEPRIQILEPVAGAQYQWSSPMPIRFTVQEEHLESEAPDVRYSIDGGENWTTFPQSIQLRSLRRDQKFLGESVLHLPLIETTGFLIQISLRDEAGNTSTAVTDQRRPIAIGHFDVDPREVAEEIYRTAIVRLTQEDDEQKRQALKLLEEALATGEPFAAAHHDFAVALEQVLGEGVDSKVAHRILNHYRRAVELDPESLDLRFSLIESLLRLEKLFSADQRKAFRREGLLAFRRVKWTDLLHAPADDEERRKLVEFRRKYLDWKESAYSVFWEDEFAE